MNAMNIHKTHRRIEVANSNIILYKTLGKSIRIPYGASVRVAWNGDRDYAFNSPERRAAIAVNACDVTKRKPEVSSVQGIYEVSVTCPMLYPTYSRTNFNLGKFTIVIHEGLFRHLQNRDWLSRYVAEYRMTNLWMLKRKG